MTPRITQLQARRLALHRSGLLKPEWGDFPKTGARSRDAQRELACAGYRPWPTCSWIRPADLELCSRLARLRPRPDVGRLLSPFDPVLWDRLRVQQLFDFEQVLEIYKPQPQRIYGYYCLPVLAGDQLLGRIDPKAERKQGRLRVLKTWYGRDRGDHGRPTAVQARAVTSAVEDWASALQLEVTGATSRALS